MRSHRNTIRQIAATAMQRNVEFLEFIDFGASGIRVRLAWRDSPSYVLAIDDGWPRFEVHQVAKSFPWTVDEFFEIVERDRNPIPAAHG